MAQSAHKRPSTGGAQARSKRTRHQDSDDENTEATYPTRSGTTVNDTKHLDEAHEQDVEDLSTQAISELETDVTTFIRNTGRNDSWPATFEKQIREREQGLSEQLRTGDAQRAEAEETFRTTFSLLLAGCLTRLGVRPVDPQRPFPSSSSSSSSTIDPSSPTDQPLFTKSATLIRESRNLLDAYTGLATLTIDTSSRDRLLGTLAKEEVAIAAAIKAGKRVAQAEVAALLGFVDVQPMEDGQQGSNVLRVGAQEAQAQARARGQSILDAGSMEKWGTVAAEAMKAFGKLSKVASADEDGGMG